MKEIPKPDEIWMLLEYKFLSQVFKSDIALSLPDSINCQWENEKKWQVNAVASQSANASPWPGAIAGDS